MTVKFKGSRVKFKQSLKKAIFSSYKSVHVFFSFLFFVFFFFTLFYTCVSIKQPHSVILLQIVMVSPGTHLEKDQSVRTIESQFKKQ